MRPRSKAAGEHVPTAPGAAREMWRLHVGEAQRAARRGDGHSPHPFETIRRPAAVRGFDVPKKARERQKARPTLI